MNPRALLAEFIGTFALIFIGVLAIHELSGPRIGLIGIALAHGLAIACLASATAAVSGGHLNPAVTIGLLVARKIDIGGAIGYIIAQCAGGLVAGVSAIYVTMEKTPLIAANGTPSLANGLTSMQGIVAEAIATFFLVFVVMGTAVDKRAPKVGALFIGLTVTMGILAIGPLTGGALNPARWIGSAIPGGKLDHPEVYIVGPILGGIVAGLIYSLFMEEKSAPESSA